MFDGVFFFVFILEFVVGVAYALVSVFLLMLPWRLAYAIRSLRWFRTKKQSTTNSTDGIILLMPVMNEEKNIDNLLRIFREMEELEKIKRIIVVTTERERIYCPESKFINLLYRSVYELNLSKLILIHDDRLNGFKSDQLQFAYQYAVANCMQGMGPYETLFLVVDADAYLNAQQISKAIHFIDDSTSIFQFFQVWEPIHTIEGTITRWYMNGFCASQNYHLLSYEIPMVNAWGAITRLRYFIGNGLFIRHETLEYLGGFPALVEDIRLGRIASGLNLTSKALPILFDVHSTSSMRSQWNQTATWFAASCTIFDDLYIAHRLRPIAPMKRAWLVVYGLHKQARWITRGIAPLLAISIGCIWDPFLLALGLILLALEAVVIHGTANAMRSHQGKCRSSHIQLGQIALFRLVSWIGPVLGLIRVATRRAEARLNKTER